MKKLYILLIMVFFTKITKAQNCSVNAGTPFALCESQDTFQLAGAESGLILVNATWSQFSGPSSTIINPSALNTKIADHSAGVYVFRISAQCQDLTNVFQDVTINVDSVPLVIVKDTNICLGGKIIPKAPSSPLPSGYTSTFSYVSGNGFGISNDGTTISNFMATCPYYLTAQLEVSNGTCSAKDTFEVTSEGTTTFNVPLIADATICGTSYYTNLLILGCGTTTSVTQISGPVPATIQNVHTNTGRVQYSITNLIQGNYTFVFNVNPTSLCGNNVINDTFNITVQTTVSLFAVNFDNSNVFICSDEQDTVYYINQTAPIPPGQNFFWDLSYNPLGLQLDTLNDVLIIKTTNPGVIKFSDLSSQIVTLSFRYGVTNNLSCSTLFLGTFFRFFKSPVLVPFEPVKTLACWENYTNLLNLTKTSMFGQSIRNVSIIAKPTGAPTPTISSSGNSISLVSNLVTPGTYTVSFSYGYITISGDFICGTLTHNVDIIVTATPGLSNAGTNQILPCGVDSTFMAGNTPPAGQKGFWEQVSGPNTLALPNPSNPTLLVKNMIPGAYTLRWTIRSGPGCSNSDNTTIFVTKPDGPPLPIDTINICYGMSVKIIGTQLSNPNSKGAWTQFLGSPVTISDTSIFNPIITGTSSSTLYGFQWLLEGYCDTIVDTVYIQTTANQGPSDASIFTSNLCIFTTTSASLSANSPTVGTGVWKFVSGPSVPTINTPTSTFTNVSGLNNAGLYTFIWEVSNGGGCDTLTDTITIAKIGVFQQYFASSPPFLEFCISNNDTISFAASPFSTSSNVAWKGRWTQTAGQLVNLEQTDSVKAKAYVIKPGIYQFRWTVGLGACLSSSSLTTVTIYDTVSNAQILTNDTLVCGINNSTTITKNFIANSPTSGTGIWSASSTNSIFPIISTPSLSSSNITLRTGVTDVIYSIKNGACESKDTVVIEIVPLSSVVSSIDQCEKENILLRGDFNGSANPIWSQISGPNSATITNPNSRTTNVTGLINGTYVFQYALAHPICDTTISSVTLNIAEMPSNIFAGIDTLICFNGATTIIPLKADTPSLYTSVSWFRTLSPGGTVSYSPNTNNLSPNATVNRVGLHQFMFTANNGACSSIDFVDVLVEQVPTPSINLNSFNGCNDTVTVQTSTNIPTYQYNWTFQDAYRYTDTSGFGLVGPLVNHWEPPTSLGNKKISIMLTNPTSGCFSRDSVFNNLSCIILPIHLVNFEANCDFGQIILQWTTAGEINSSHFVIERSIDGNTWIKVGQIKSIGNSFQQMNYQFNDMMSQIYGNSFYRLKMVDQDGSFEYSNITYIDCQRSQLNNIKLYPNPINDYLEIASTEMIQTVEILTIEGKILIREEGREAQQKTINTSELAPGMYILKVNGVGYRLIKQ